MMVTSMVFCGVLDDFVLRMAEQNTLALEAGRGLELWIHEGTFCEVTVTLCNALLQRYEK